MNLFRNREKELENYLNTKMPGHNFRVTGNLHKKFDIDCTGLKTQLHIISFTVNDWMHNHGFPPVPVHYTGD